MSMTAKGAAVFLENVATNNVEKVWPGGKAWFMAKGTWGGGSVKLQVKLPDNTTYVDVTGASLTADGYIVLAELPPGTYRTVVATATALYVRLVHTPS
jgi:hypothetical protein